MDFQEDPISGSRESDRYIHCSSRQVPIITEESKLILVLKKACKLQNSNSQEYPTNSNWLLEAVCIQRPELWATVGYMKLCVDRNLKCGWELVT